MHDKANAKSYFDVERILLGLVLLTNDDVPTKATFIYDLINAR